MSYFSIIAAKNQRIFKKIKPDIQIKEADDDKKQPYTKAHDTAEKVNQKAINKRLKINGYRFINLEI